MALPMPYKVSSHGMRRLAACCAYASFAIAGERVQRGVWQALRDANHPGNLSALPGRSASSLQPELARAAKHGVLW